MWLCKTAGAHPPRRAPTVFFAALTSVRLFYKCFYKKLLIELRHWKNIGKRSLALDERSCDRVRAKENHGSTRAMRRRCASCASAVFTQLFNATHPMTKQEVAAAVGVSCPPSTRHSTHSMIAAFWPQARSAAAPEAGARQRFGSHMTAREPSASRSPDRDARRRLQPLRRAIHGTRHRYGARRVLKRRRAQHGPAQARG